MLLCSTFWRYLRPPPLRDKKYDEKENYMDDQSLCVFYEWTHVESTYGAIRVDLDPLSDERKELLKLYKENAFIKGYTEKSEYNLTALDYKLFDLIYKLTGDKVRFWGKDEKQRAKTIPNE